MPLCDRWTIWTIYTIIFVDLFQLSFVFPFIPTIVASFGGGEHTVALRVALLSSLAAFGEMLGSPILGSFSDKVGRRKVLLLSSLTSAFSAAALGFAWRFEVAAMARVVNGLAGGTCSIAYTKLTDATTEEERPPYLSKATAMVGLGLSFGPIVGGFLFEMGGVEYACLSSAGVSFANFLLVFFCLGKDAKESPNQDADETSKAPDKSLPCAIYLLFVSSFLQAPLFVVFDTFANLYVTSQFYGGDEVQGTILFSYAMAIVGVCLTVIPLFIYPAWLERVGLDGSIVIGMGTVVVGCFATGLATGPRMWLLTIGLWAVGFQLVGPAVPCLLCRLAPPEISGKIFGLYDSAGNIARVLGPSALTPLYNWYPASVFFCLSFLMFMSSAIMFSVNRSNPATAPRADSEDFDSPPEEKMPSDGSAPPTPARLL